MTTKNIQMLSIDIATIAALPISKTLLRILFSLGNVESAA